jgi:DNA polymerase-3 subunit chi
MTEILFYQLERQSLFNILPQVLEKTLARGWRALVQAGAQERLEALSSHLWSFRDEAFLPHGSAEDGNEELQPVFLTCEDVNPNGAHVRFFVDGADGEEFNGYERVVFMFDGNDQEAVERARARWKAVKAQGLEVTYWQQNEAGTWIKKA